MNSQIARVDKKVVQLEGVSIATFSRCLNDPEKLEEKQKRIKAAIRQTGYSPNTLAQSYRPGKTQQIMVVLPSVGDHYLARQWHA